MNNQMLIDKLRTVPDWPIKGVNFRDITTLLKDPKCLKEISDEMYDLYKDKGITKIAGIESRGFIMASALATRIGAGVILCRKPGKLPCPTVQQSYAKEYGIDTIEMHKDSIKPGQKVAIVDDLIATGGTIEAAIKLVEELGGEVVKVIFLMELAGLHGRERLKGYDVESVICYEGK